MGTVGQSVSKSASIEGKVLDAQGIPVDRVGIRALSVDPPAELLQENTGLPPTGSTGISGEFRIQDLSPGRYILEFEKSGYALRSVPFTLISEQRLLNTIIRLSPTGVISGRVLKANGEPTVGAVVTALCNRPSRGGIEMVAAATVTTDDRGAFRLIDLVPDRYVVSVSSSGRNALSSESGPSSLIPPTLYPGVGDLSRAVGVDVRGGEEARLTPITLGGARLGGLRIHLINRPSEPAKDIEFSLAVTTKTIKNSRVISAGSSLPPVRLPLSVGERLTKEFWPSQPGLFKAILRWTDSKGMTHYSVTPISFSGLEMDIDIRLETQLGRLNIHAVREISDGSVAALSEGAIGLCKASNSHSTSDFWIVEPLRPFGSTQPLPRFKNGKIALTQASGQYEIQAIELPQPMYLAKAEQAGRNALTEGIEISAEAAPLELRIRDGVGTIQGKVVDRSQRPVADALVAILPVPPLDKAKLQALRKGVRTDQNGFFQFQGVVPGEYRGYAWVSVSSDIYLDPSFVGSFQNAGILIRVEERTQASVNLTVLI
jgi:hypothetical protein